MLKYGKVFVVLEIEKPDRIGAQHNYTIQSDRRLVGDSSFETAGEDLFMFLRNTTCPHAHMDVQLSSGYHRLSLSSIIICLVGRAALIDVEHLL